MGSGDGKAFEIDAEIDAERDGTERNDTIDSEADTENVTEATGVGSDDSEATKIEAGTDSE